MFEQSGRKLKLLAKILFFLNCTISWLIAATVVSVINQTGISLFRMRVYPQLVESIVLFLFILGIGLVSSFILSLLLYFLGKFIEKHEI
ncbi:MAG: hypothetical protein IJD90_05890 [Clostridia bacterium]|nr:hypothetical protein [Clostridia bacterium]